jgi:ABC-2 type transport system ATP-binding protein
MTVREFAGLMEGCYPRWDNEPVRKIISGVGIEWKDKLQTLSRGQRALVALAVAIGHQPDLLLLDEALTGLDPIARREVLRNIIDAMHEEGRTVFITGQDIPDMERIIDHVGFLVGGHMMVESPLEDLKARVKRIRVDHPPEAEVEAPASALNVVRHPRETQFTVQDYKPTLLQSYSAVGMRAEAMDLTLEDMFIDLAQSKLKLVPRSEEASPLRGVAAEGK